MLAAPVGAESLRIATYHTELERDGPGLLLRDIARGAEDVAAVANVINTVRPDILLLLGFDYDHDLRALTAFAGLTDYPHLFALPPNTGVPTGLDLDGNGRLGEPRDAQGYGQFRGQGGMAILSRHPLGEAREFSTFLWRDLPDPIIPEGFYADEALAVQRLSTTAHWDVPVLVEGRALHLLTWHASPPVFDGPEDRNGRRNHDEAAFWLRYLDGDLPQPGPEGAFVLLGGANLDPVDGDGRPGAIAALLNHPRLNDPMPRSEGGAAAANAGQRGDPALDTAVFSADGPGNLRVDYVLPSRELTVKDAGVHWPTGDETVATASRHRLVWVDVEF